MMDQINAVDIQFQHVQINIFKKSRNITKEGTWTNKGLRDQTIQMTLRRESDGLREYNCCSSSGKVNSEETVSQYNHVGK